MNWNRFSLPLIALTLSASCGAQEESVAEAPAVASDPAALVAKANELLTASEGSNAIGVQGEDASWWFLRNELKHLAVGDFTELETWPNDGATDPVPVIASYSKALEALGVELLLVPVPPKAAIYPEKLATGGATPPIAPFMARLTAAGVKAIDLEPVFQSVLAESDDKLYCQQDSHWSPKACEIVAKLIAERYAGADWIAESNLTVGEPEAIAVHGDLLSDEDKATEPKEELTVTYVGGGTPPEPDKESPVMLMGDSHTLIFHSGNDMHTKGAGLTDHLAAQLGFPVDLEASMGSGADSARVNVARRTNLEKDLWDKKKLVIWCFSAREFTQGKWREIPAKVGE